MTSYYGSGNQNTGWICPKCGRCFAPSVKQCDTCGQTVKPPTASPPDTGPRINNPPYGSDEWLRLKREFESSRPIIDPQMGPLPTSDDLYKKYPAVDIGGKAKGQP